MKRLVYESYNEMAVKLMNEVCNEINQQWPEVRKIIIHHRYIRLYFNAMMGNMCLWEVSVQREIIRLQVGRSSCW